MNQKGFAHLILVVIVIGILAAAGGGIWYSQQSAKQTKDDLGCWPPSCSLLPEPGKQLCTDWKAGKEVSWPDCSYMASFPKCQKLCESEKKNNPQQANTVFDPNSAANDQPPTGSESFVMSMKEVSPACITDGEDHRAQLVYARPQDTSDRYDEMVPKLRKWIAQGNRIINDEAKRFNVKANLKMACEGGKLSVLNVVLTTVTTKRADVELLTAEFRSKGFKDDKVKYIVWYDGIVTNADGSRGSKAEAWLDNWPTTQFGKPQDDRPTDDNAFNQGADFAFIYQLFEKDFVPIAMLHEYSHTMGVIQSSAPHHSGDGHCNDSKPVGRGGQDMNCGYNVSNPNTNPNQVFGSACDGFGFRYDCGNDDYFNPKPEKGSYLDTHWNVGLPMNKFIKFD